MTPTPFRKNGTARKEYMEKSQKSHLGTIIIAIIIIGALLAFVIPKYLGRMSGAKGKVAISQIELFGSALDTFRIDVGRYPTTKEGLKVLREKPPEADGWDGPYVQEDIPLDPWGKPYIYRCPGEHDEYDLLSYGEDGVKGGDGENKDIVSWESSEK